MEGLGKDCGNDNRIRYKIDFQSQWVSSWIALERCYVNGHYR